MLKKFFSKITSSKIYQNIAQDSFQFRPGYYFRTQCKKIIQQYPTFLQSTYFTTHLQLLLQNPTIQQIFQNKIKIIQNKYRINKQYQMQLASIVLNIMEEDGLFYIFITLWISFCVFQFKKIVGQGKIGQKEKGQLICKFFHKEFFLLCYFMYQMSLYVYKEPFKKSKQFNATSLFKLIRDTTTAVSKWSQIHQFFRTQVKFQSYMFTDKQIQQNIKDLQKVCKIFLIPAPFLQSTNLLKQFLRTTDVKQKLKKAVILINQLKIQMDQYRIVNKMDTNFGQYVYAADDVLTALTYVMWRVKKNIYGACVYIQIILCCEFKNIDDQHLAKQLNQYGNGVRHAFETIISVAKIGAIEEEKLYL